MPAKSSSVRPKQSLGQNFLVDDNIARNIARDAHLMENDVVVEIGPGHGALTKYLVKRVRHLIAVEIDRRVVNELRNLYESPSVTILHQDFLETDVADLCGKFGTKLRVMGNIPYHLTSEILIKIFDAREFVRDITIMVQKEVARRIVAKPGTKACGILSVFSQFYGIPRLMFDVSPNCFYPRPNVTSTLVQLKLFDELSESVDVDLFKTLVRTAFGKRRKTLRNSLKYLPIDEDVAARFLSESEIPMHIRAEELTVEDWVKLTHELEKCNA